MSDATRENIERLAAIGEIAAEVAHELRNALQIISANVYLAKQDLAKSEPHLAKIERNARLAHSIVDDLMALARGEPAHAEPILLAEAVLASREALPEAAASAVWDDRIDPPQLRVRAHQGLLSRLLHVLYENAVAACAPRPATIVTRGFADPERSLSVIEVADDGPGVPAEIASTIFDPLVTARPGGTGLGLALARRLVAAHGGTIALVPSQKGATFRMELPSR
ncbi:MAG: sensor histidine kinase [Deltaproteobacteria bacterium]|nr:sensor histidine kinase [Deltaproteobacteria bacterium]